MKNKKTPVLTLHAPWPHCIFNQVLGKDIENRTWKPPDKLIGKRLAIHTAVTLHKVAFEQAVNVAGRDLLLASHSMGCIVGTVQLMGYFHVAADGSITRHGFIPAVVDIENNKWMQRQPGNCGWWLRDPRKLHVPIRARGNRNIWYADGVL